MSAIYFLIACSIIIAVIFLAAFFWANKRGQYEDTYTPSVRILFDEAVEDVREKEASVPDDEKPEKIKEASDESR